MIFEVTLSSVLESYFFPAFSVKEVLVSSHLTTLSGRLSYYIAFTIQMPYTMPYLCVLIDQVAPMFFGSIRYRSVVGPRPSRGVSISGQNSLLIKHFMPSFLIDIFPIYRRRLLFLGGPQIAIYDTEAST